MENLVRHSLLATSIQYTNSLYSVQTVQLVIKNLSQVVKTVDNNLKFVTKQVHKAMMT